VQPHQLLLGHLQLDVLVALRADIRIATVGAVGSAAYRRRRGQPRTLAEFQAQRWAVFDRDLPMLAPWWRASFGPKAALPTRMVCCVPNLEELLALAEAGVALTVLPDYLVAPAVEERRVMVLAPAAGQYSRQRAAGNTLFLAWRQGLVESARIRVVRQALVREAA
jgi:DNA-binding transcriptional LysR family regulator